MGIVLVFPISFLYDDDCFECFCFVECNVPLIFQVFFNALRFFWHVTSSIRECFDIGWVKNVEFLGLFCIEDAISVPVVPHEVVAEESKKMLVVVNHGQRGEFTDGPKGGWSCVCV